MLRLERGVHMHHQLTEAERARLLTLDSFREGVEIALASLVRLSDGEEEIIQLCGPMSTGGRGSLAANMAYFEAAMRHAHDRGKRVFNQIPYQGMMIRLTSFREGMPVKEYNHQILEGFYRPVLASGLISAAVFLPDWRTSHGATWERSVAKEIGLPIIEYPPEWVAELEMSSV